MRCKLPCLILVLGSTLLGVLGQEKPQASLETRRLHDEFKMKQKSSKAAELLEMYMNDATFSAHGGQRTLLEAKQKLEESTMSAGKKATYSKEEENSFWNRLLQVNEGSFSVPTQAPVGLPTMFPGNLPTLPPADLPNLYDLANIAGLTTLIALIDQAGLGDALRAPEPSKTVFGPSNEAFASLLTDVPLVTKFLEPQYSAQLFDILTYHVYVGALSPIQLSGGPASTSGSQSSTDEASNIPDGTMLEMINGRIITVNFVGNTANLSDEFGQTIAVATVDQLASNGIAQILGSGVLVPGWVSKTITDAFANDPSFSILLELLQQTNLDGVLDNPGGNFTVFAPTNSAFEKLLGETGLTLEDVKLLPNLADILLLHVLGDVFPSSAVNEAVSTTTTALSGNQVTITGGTTIKYQVSGSNSADVLANKADVLANNGVVQGVDTVLLPPPVATDPPVTPAPTPLSTSAPTPPTVGVPLPTSSPTLPPTTPATTGAPTLAPTAAPTIAPTQAPTRAPTPVPTAALTPGPTPAPTPVPTLAPTQAPTPVPTLAPTQAPTLVPTLAPTQAPTQVPTLVPTRAPTPLPTPAPTPAPTMNRAEQVVRANALFQGAEFIDPESHQSKALAWISGSNFAPYTDVQILERYSLACIYYATNQVFTVFANATYNGNIPLWFREGSWVTDADHCTWFGIQCNEITGRVRALNLASNLMSGTFPAEVVYLSQSLEVWVMSNNPVFTDGDFFNQYLGQLTNLKALSISSTAFSSRRGLPLELSKLTQLEFLEMANTLYRGPLDPNVFLPNDPFIFIDIEGNGFDFSPIPSAFGQMPDLQYLAIGDNELTGDLSFLTTASNLQLVFVDDNFLDGTLPANIASPVIQALSLSNNAFSGTFPPEWAEYDELIAIIAYRNALTGGIPAENGSSSMTNLFFELNAMNVDVPVVICNILLRGLLSNSVRGDCCICRANNCCSSCEATLAENSTLCPFEEGEYVLPVAPLTSP